VGESARWCRLLARAAGARSFVPPQIGESPNLASIPLDDPVAMWGIMTNQDYGSAVRKRIVGAITALRSAHAVIAGPLTDDDGDGDFYAPGLLPHLADLARDAYRALRPPRWLVAHPGFGQVARRFDYVQLSHDQARLLGSGAIDGGVLAQRLRQVQGDGGECAVTAFPGQGCLWAGGRWWPIAPIATGPVDEAAANDAFCTAWVVARRFFAAGAPAALQFAREMAAVASAQPEKGLDAGRAKLLRPDVGRKDAGRGPALAG